MNIYRYSNFREFLRDYYEDRKRNISGFSYAKFCKMANFRSTNYLKLIIEGKRNLTVENIHLLARVFQFSFDEEKFFCALVHFNQSKDPLTKKFYHNLLKKVGKGKPTLSSRTSKHQIISNWFVPAVLISAPGNLLSEAPRNISKLVGISEKVAKKVIDDLVAQNILVQDGLYIRQSNDTFVIEDKRLRSSVHKKFFKEHLNLAISKISTDYEKRAKFFSHSFLISTENFNKYVEEIRKFIEEIVSQSEHESHEEVVQLNMQFFPLS